MEECETKSGTYCSIPARIKDCVLELLLLVEYQNQSSIAEPSCCNQEEPRQALLVLRGMPFEFGGKYGQRKSQSGVDEHDNEGRTVRSSSNIELLVQPDLTVGRQRL